MHLYAADLGRGPDGRWWVLDDRTQAPSGAGYALENRMVLSGAFPELYSAMNVQRLAPFFSDFRASLAGAAHRTDPRICLMTPGPYSETYFEQARLARYLGFLLVEGDDLVVRDRRAYVRTIAGLKRADVIWRRVDADFIDPLELNSASRLGVPGLLEAIRAGGVVVSNLPGTGVVESRALLSFLPALCRRLLGEPLKLPNVATWWCGQPAERALVESRIDSLALARAFGARGHPHACRRRPRMLADLPAADRDSLIACLRERPMDFVGQEVVRLSTTPSWRDGGATTQPVRPSRSMPPPRRTAGASCPAASAVSPTSPTPAPSRWGRARAPPTCGCSRQRPVEPVTLLGRPDDVKVRRFPGNLPSRAADNLFWLGRYLERAEATLRLVRSLCTSLMDADAAVHGSGETLEKLLALLVAWGAVDKDVPATVPEDAFAALYDIEAYGSALRLIGGARRTAAGMRERLSEDFWKQLRRLADTFAQSPAAPLPASECLARAEAAINALATLAGLTSENMIRVAGWRFLDMGRRLERGVNICRFMRQFAVEGATLDDLDLLLDLADSQITYRARYLEDMAPSPVRDLVMLDPHNPRALAFQVDTLKEHVAALPKLVADGMLEEPARLLIQLSSAIEVADAHTLDAKTALAFENTLLALSDAIGERYFLQGAKATPTKKFAGLA